MQCTTCGHENRDGSSFCSYCGEHLNPSPSPAGSRAVGRACPGCGSVCTSDARFCPSCGTALKVFDAPPPVALSPQQASLEALGDLDLPWTKTPPIKSGGIPDETYDHSVEPTVMYDPASDMATLTPILAAPAPAAPTSIAPPSASSTARAQTPKETVKTSIGKRNLLVGMVLGLVLLGGGTSFWAYRSISDSPPSVPAPTAATQTLASPPAFAPPNDADAVFSAPVEAAPDIETERGPPTAEKPPVPDTDPASPLAASGPLGMSEDEAAKPDMVVTPRPESRPSARRATPATVAKSAGQTEAWLSALRQDLNQCSPLGFFARVACREKARWKYCNDRWNSVPECAVGTKGTP